MSVFIECADGLPSVRDLPKWERDNLFNPLLEVIKEFYRDPENCKKYELWLETKKSAVALSTSTDELAC